MNRLYALAQNAFMEVVRQPIYLFLMLGSVLMIALAPVFATFVLNEEVRMVKDIGLSTMMLSGLMCSAFAASSAIANEIRNRTALSVIAKPVSRAEFIVGKYLGIAAALMMLLLVELLVCLIASRAVIEGFGSDPLGALAQTVAILSALILSAIANFKFSRPFVSTTVVLMALFLGIAFLFVGFKSTKVDVLWTADVKTTGFAAGMDMRLIPAGILIWFCMLLLSSVAVAVSTRVDATPTLVICSAIFLMGLISDYALGRWEGQSSVLSVLYRLMPNIQFYWMADALRPKTAIPIQYLGWVAVYTGCLVSACLTIATMLFERREVG